MDYRVLVTAYFDVYVSAESRQEAIEKAEHEVLVELDKMPTGTVEYDYSECENHRLDVTELN